MDRIVGYRGMCSNQGIYIDNEDALMYAMEQCGIKPSNERDMDAEFTDMLVEWYYSGDWIADTKGGM